METINYIFFALLVGQVSTCLQPYATVQTNSSWSSRFKMTPGDEICIDGQKIRLAVSSWNASTELLYKTAAWTYSVSPATWNCDWGACDTEACVDKNFGVRNKTTVDLSKATDSVTSSYCHVFPGATGCFSLYGCIHADVNVKIQLDELASVYRVRQPTADFAIEGRIPGCTYQLRTRRTPAVGMGVILSLADGVERYCMTTGNRGYPVQGQLGDIQILDTGSFSFDWDSVKIALDWETPPYVGIAESFLSSVQDGCRSLPAEIDRFRWMKVGNNTRDIMIVDNEPVDVELTCDHIPKQHHVNEVCYDVIKEIHGLRDSGFGLMLRVRASSKNGTGSLRLKSSCGEENDLIIQCDGRYHISKIDDQNDCLYTIADIVDKTEPSSRAGYLIERHRIGQDNSGWDWSLGHLGGGWREKLLALVIGSSTIIFIVALIFICLRR